jgi:two-component system, NarL family, response regulator DevR
VTSSPTTSIDVLVVDDSTIVRQRLCGLLREDPRLRVVGQAGSTAEAVQQFEELRPDAVVLDYRLPDGNGLDVLRRIKDAAPWCLVIMLTNLREQALGEICRACGADHYFHKATEFERVVQVLGDLASTACAQPHESAGGQD